MYKICITEQSAKRQRELELGLLDAMQTRQYEDITVSDLCDMLNIPRKSFYRYFSSKDGALFALIDHTMMDFTGEFFSHELAATIDTLEHFFQFWKQQEPLLTALRRSDLSGILLQRSFIKAAEDDLVARQLFRTREKHSQLYVVNFLVSGLISLVLQWHVGGFHETPRQLAELATEILTRNLITDPFD